MSYSVGDIGGLFLKYRGCGVNTCKRFYERESAT
jgi:hypothetical protein